MVTTTWLVSIGAHVTVYNWFTDTNSTTLLGRLFLIWEMSIDLTLIILYWCPAHYFVLILCVSMSMLHDHMFFIYLVTVDSEITGLTALTNRIAIEWLCHSLFSYQPLLSVTCQRGRVSSSANLDMSGLEPEGCKRTLHNLHYICHNVSVSKSFNVYFPEWNVANFLLTSIIISTVLMSTKFNLFSAELECCLTLNDRGILHGISFRIEP